ncbi:MAG: tripartite tricarboxylate transporter substrate binding protein [Burkholderiales bacterium]
MSRLSPLIAGLLAAAALPAAAQTYPDRPIRLVVPYAPGGGTDLTSRLIALRLTESFKQQVIVDNRAGGASNIGAEIVARSAPDGYTLMMAGISFSINVSIFPKLGYDPIKDFDPVSLVATVPLIVVVHPSVPAANIKELIALAKAKPGTLNYASGGAGTANHIAGELFKYMTNTDIVHVPYKGGGPALADVVGGQVQLLFNTMTSTVGFMNSGKLRALAVTGKQRSPGVPSVPTVAEAGVPGYDVGAWFGIVVPRGTPKPIVTRLNGEIVRIARLPEAREQFVAQGAEAVGSTPEAFGQHLRVEIDKWAKVAKAAKMRAE